MRVCIIAEDAKVKEIRTDMKNERILTIGLSVDGKLPATHWFCCMAMPEDKANELVSSAKLSTIEIAEPKEFLNRWNLQIIK